MVCEDLVSDCVHEMSLAKPHAAVNEERVVRGEPGCIGDRLCHRIRELVRAAHDEGVEGVLRVQRCWIVGCRCGRALGCERETALRGGAFLLCLCGFGFFCGRFCLCGWFLLRVGDRGVDDDLECIACAERLLDNITEEYAITRLDVMLSCNDIHGEDEFIVFERNGNHGGDPLLYDLFVDDSVGLFKHFFPLALNGGGLFYGHTSASLQKIFWYDMSVYPQTYSQLLINAATNKER